MTLSLIILIGLLFGIGVYMLLRRSLVKAIIGIALLGYGTNLLIFVSAKLNEGRPPVIKPDEIALQAPYADPVPQALILTAIVISFGVLAFAMVLIKRTYQAFGTDDPDALQEGDEE